MPPIILVLRDSAVPTMIDGLGRLLAILSIAAGAVEAQTVCQSGNVAAAANDLDLAPPAGYVEICSKDADLCRILTAGYPPSVTTLGYFVTAAEWRAYKESPPRGFTRYLIPQLARSMSPADLPGFKQYLRAQQGDIPDHTRLPSVLEFESRVPLGIFDEGDSSMSFGTIIKLRPSLADPNQPPTVTLVATNSMLVIKQRVLSLYVYREFRTLADVDDVDSTEHLTKVWLSCLRHAN